MKNYLSNLTSKSWQTIELLCATAQKGLTDCYSEKDFFGQGPSSDNRKSRLNMYLNLRYIVMAQIGIKRWLRFCGNGDASLPNFWKYISSRSHEIDNAGDIGLLIWAGVESEADDCRAFTENLVDNWARLSVTCNAVELAWVIQGIVRFLEYQPITGEMTDVLKDAHNRLMDLYCNDIGLFAKHSRKGLKNVISRRIACFADQVYPILALASYGQLFNDARSINAAITVSDTICRLQGADGQWWWHYDLKRATIAEEYPVFSVHQDGMAPMALLAIDKVAETNHSPYIEKGLMWLCGRNELNTNMIVPEEGIIWRDIHRREIHKMYRIARGALITAGLHTAHSFTGRKLFGYVINRECRPYHLGWILYAWADYRSDG